MNSLISSNPVYFALFTGASSSTAGSAADEATDQPTNRIDFKDFVSSDQKTIIELGRKHRGSRFKGFSTYEAALQFAENGDVCDNSTADATNDIASANTSVPEFSSFPSLPTKSLSAFRRHIEADKIDEVKSRVDENPRYLLSYNYDGPTILMAGPHFNAVHLAARKNAVNVLRFVLQTVDSCEFIQRCYPSLDDNYIADKQQHLLDLYLNTPDKASFDSPLHMACRNNSLESIEILLDYAPLIVVNRRNKMGQLPIDAIRDESLKAHVNLLLNSCSFVTVRRSEDHLDFTITRPCYGRKSLHFYGENGGNLDQKKISAILGPTTPDKAEELYKTLRSPTLCTTKQRSIRLKDPLRGVEKVARDISYQLKVPCFEYWYFLDDCVDIGNDETLGKLNDHLRKQHDNNRELEEFSRIFDKKLTIADTNAVDGDDANSKEVDDEALDVFHDCNDSFKNFDYHNSHYDEDDDDDDCDAYVSAPSSPIRDFDENFCDRGKNNYFIEGLQISKIDHEVLAALQLAIDNGTLCIDDRTRERYPYVYDWFHAVTAAEERNGEEEKKAKQ